MKRGQASPIVDLLPPQDGGGLARLPDPSPGDIFLDCEGDSFASNGGQEYLVGYVLVSESGESEYRARWGLDHAAEKEAFERFVDDVMERWAEYPGQA